MTAARAVWTPQRAALRDTGRRRRSVKLPDTAAILLAALLIFAQLVALGANTALLSALAACADILVAVAILLLVRPEQRLWLGLAPVLLPLALALVWAAIPALAADHVALPMAGRPAPDAFPLEFAKLLGFFACLVAGVALGHRPGVTRRFFDVFALLGIAYVLLALVLRQNDPTSVYGIDKGFQRIRFTGTLLSANAAACVFGVIAIMAFGRCQLAWRQAAGADWPARATLLTGLCAVATLLALGACALTRSRASLVLAVLAIMAMVLRQWRRALFGTHPALRYGVPVALLAALGGVALLAGPTIDRFSTFSRDVAERSHGIAHFLALADRSPWFGYGLGSFFPLNVATLDPAHVDTMWNLGAAHDAPIQAALEGGWPFALLILIAIAVAVVRTVRARRVETPDPLMLAQLLAAALIFACALADIALNVPAICAMAALLSGMALGRVERATALVRSAARPDRP